MMIWRKVKKIFSRSKARVPIFIGKRVLTIEDDSVQRTMIQRTLAKRGYSVLLAETGEKGLDMARNQNPDLILLDVVLPGINGNEVCKRLKFDTQTKKIPIIFLTSMDQPKDIIQHYDLGGEIHLSKPISAKELLRQVEISLSETPIS